MAILATSQINGSVVTPDLNLKAIRTFVPLTADKSISPDCVNT